MFEEIHIWSPSFKSDETLSIMKLPSKMIHDHYDEILFKKILERTKRNGIRTLHLFSDCGAEKIKKRNNQNFLDDAMFNTRHYNTSFIIDCQNVNSLSSAMTQNADGVCLFECLNNIERYKLYQNFGCYSFRDFIYLWNVATEKPYSFLFINNQGPKQEHFSKFSKKLDFRVDDKDYIITEGNPNKRKLSVDPDEHRAKKHKLFHRLERSGVWDNGKFHLDRSISNPEFVQLLREVSDFARYLVQYNGPK